MNLLMATVARRLRCTHAGRRSACASVRALQDRLHQVAQLLCCELIPVQIRGHSSVPINYHRVEGVRQDSFVVPEVHAKQLCYVPNIGKFAV